MLKKYDTTQDAQPHLPAALPSSEMVVHITGRSFMQRLSGYFCRHELEFWVFQLLLVPLLVLLVLVATVYKGNIMEALIKAHYNRVCRGNQRQQAKDEAILGGK